MNIQEFRLAMDDALKEEGLEERKLVPKQPKVWALPASDIIRFFSPYAYRRPWGYVYSGSIGVEIPGLRRWLEQHKPGNEVGIFHSCFVSYSIANEDILGDFSIEHGEPVPVDLWAGLLRDRLERLPPTLDDMITTYRRNKENLGWLAHPYEQKAWEFVLDWCNDPRPSLHVPTMLPNGQIV